MALDPCYSTVIYLLGSDGKVFDSENPTDAANSYSYTGSGDAGKGPAHGRKKFRHHLIQRVIRAGTLTDPAVKIQACLIKPADAADNEDWITLATLNNATPWVSIPNASFPYIRALRDDDTDGPIKVICSSTNDLPDVG